MVFDSIDRKKVSIGNDDNVYEETQSIMKHSHWFSKCVSKENVTAYSSNQMNIHSLLLKTIKKIEQFQQNVYINFVMIKFFFISSVFFMSHFFHINGGWWKHQTLEKNIKKGF